MCSSSCSSSCYGQYIACPPCNNTIYNALYRFVFRKQVIMGGGKKSFEANSPPNPKETVEKSLCVRSDRRDLIREWIDDKQSNNLSHQFLTNVHDMKSLDTEQTEYVLGESNNLL